MSQGDVAKLKTSAFSTDHRVEFGQKVEASSNAVRIDVDPVNSTRPELQGSKHRKARAATDVEDPSSSELSVRKQFEQPAPRLGKPVVINRACERSPVLSEGKSVARPCRVHTSAPLRNRNLAPW